MTSVAVFHSALGVRPGINDAADRLRAAGHEVLIVDQYAGRVFDDYATASAFVEEVGFEELMRRAIEAVDVLPDGFVALGFSNGAGMAEHVALTRHVAGVVMISGALPVEMAGGTAWPAGVPAQIHYAADDPYRRQDWADALADSIRAAGGPLETFDYAGDGHLFTDPSLTGEYHPAEAETLWQRVLGFGPLQE